MDTVSLVPTPAEARSCGRFAGQWASLCNPKERVLEASLVTCHHSGSTPWPGLNTRGQGWGGLGEACLSGDEGSQLQGSSWPLPSGSPLRPQMMSNKTGAQVGEGACRVAGAGVVQGCLSAQPFPTAAVSRDPLLLAQLFSSCVLFSLKMMWKRLAFYYCY